MSETEIDTVSDGKPDGPAIKDKDGTSSMEKGSSQTNTLVEGSEVVEPQTDFIIKPALEDKIKTIPIKEIILQVLHSTLGDQTYDSDNAKKWTISIANVINQGIRDLHMKRYKHIVQVTIGELKGAGVKSGLRCLWDSETDSYTSEIFMNDTIFALVIVFVVYLY